MQLLPETEEVMGKSGRMYTCYVIASPMEKGAAIHYLDRETLLCVNRVEDPDYRVYQIPFAYENYGRVAILAKNVTEAKKYAAHAVETMSLKSLEAMSDYLPDSAEIDEDGIVLDGDGNVVEGKPTVLNNSKYLNYF